MKRVLLVVASSLMFTGCASVLNDSNHPMRLETKTADGKLVSGADCKITNDYGSISMKSGDTAQVRRSSKNLDITCSHPQNPEASARAISRANGGMWGNIILGGGIGAIIDHNKGTAYTYPTWVQLIFGKVLTFDRRDEREGTPVNSSDPGAASTVSAAADVSTSGK